jgi:hypothetical protein
MYVMIIVSFVIFQNTTINVAQTQLQERYTNEGACQAAGQAMKLQSTTAKLVDDLRVGFICVQAGTAKPLS